MSYLYADVDSIADPQIALAWQERLARLPGIRRYKAWTRGMLGGDGPILDVGIGPATDSQELGIHRLVGADISRVMCNAARERGVAVCLATGAELPFADNVFSGCRADRVLQHIGDPAPFVEEMSRVTVVGGRVILVDPDQESLTIHLAGVDPDLIARVKATRRDVSFQNGRGARCHAELLVSHGLVDLTVDAFGVLVTDPADGFGIADWITDWRAQGVQAFSSRDDSVWRAALTSAGPGDFVLGLLYLVVSARTAIATA